MKYLDIFLVFFKIGLFSFGGGYAMIPLIQSEVLARNWMSSEEIINFIAVSESTPGSFAVNIATYIGSSTGGFPGAIFATLGVILPSFLIIALIQKGYSKFQNSIYVKGAMSGLHPAVIAMIGTAFLSVGETVVKQDFYLSLCCGLLFLLSFFLLKKKLHPIAIIVLCAIAGISIGFIGEQFHFL
ncbi:chromate transporter [Anaeromicropila populeti]|uniref:Chromate transporter n=1 Tax=Anaeromicropila populeti TaxID=37658 RepID=A0A1I6LNU7_9FIRM|nr:chromate transporter [Anaeromicropila populeti]SFS05166.1 chromate transporter [Anaeromicropila populeti]